MSQNSAGPEILRLIELISRLPGLGPRSARRVALFLLKRRDTLLKPLADALAEAGEKIERCKVCGNFDTVQPCAVCQAGGRDDALVCVVEDVPDLWALERGGAFRGRYHVLGGVLSAIDGITPDDLNIPSLVTRVDAGGIREVKGVSVTRLAHGVPVGGELDHLDDGTLAAALRSRRDI